MDFRIDEQTVEDGVYPLNMNLIKLLRGDDTFYARRFYESQEEDDFDFSQLYPEPTE